MCSFPKGLKGHLGSISFIKNPCKFLIKPCVLLCVRGAREAYNTPRWSKSLGIPKVSM